MLTSLVKLPSTLLLTRNTAWHLGRLSLSSWTEDDILKAKKKLAPSYNVYGCFIEKTCKDVKGGIATGSSKIAAKWKDLTKEERGQIEEIFRREKIWAQKVVDEADPRVLAEINVWDEEKNLKLRKSRQKRLEKDLQKPSKNFSGYSMFISDNIPVTDAKGKVSDRFSSMAKLWKSQPDSVKEKYQAMATKEREKYQEDLKEWKLKVADNAELVKAAKNVQVAKLRLKAAKAKLNDTQIST